MTTIVYLIIYQALLYVVGTYALCAAVAGYPIARKTLWLVGGVLVTLFAALATILMRVTLPAGAVITRDLVASYIGLYAIPMTLTLGVASGLQLRRLPPWVKLLALIVASVAGMMAGQYVAGGLFEMVNASG